jgi:hypothetical protein
MSEEKLVEQIKFEGNRVVLGGQEFVVPCLSVKQARTLWPEILEMDEGITKQNLPEKQGKWMDIVHAAMSRNYPGLKKEELEELVDLGNLRRLMMIVMGNSGVPAVVVPNEKPDAEKPLPIQ